MSKTSPAFTILTWGCQMNEDDSEQISNLLMQMGYSPVKEIEDADIIMLNTCSVRAKPEQKVRSKLGELKFLKDENPDLIIGVCGCMAQKEGKFIRERAPHVDMVVGTANIDRIPELLCDIIQRRSPLASLDLPRKAADESRLPGRVERADEGTLKSFVPVMYGCDNFCAYCVVPYVRGKERSRPLDEIVSEVKSLVSRGRKEITLLGQNVNSYGKADGWDVDFADLLMALNEVEGLERIRFMTSHPKDLSDKLIEAMASLPKVCEHIHLPIQAADDSVLKNMRRGYTVGEYREKLTKLREAVPDVAVTTDILIGFPGETDEQFENTLRFIEEARYDAAFMFAYNPIKNTSAAKMPDQVDPKVKNARLRKVIGLQNRITVEKNEEDIGKVFDVLVEGRSPKDKSKLTGLTRQNKTVNFPCDRDLTGRTVKVKAVKAHLWGFAGEME